MASIAAVEHDVADLALASEGERLIGWSGQQMPVLQLIRERFEREQPLRGQRIGACLHVTSETANLMITLKAGGAEVRLCASNPLSTQDPVAAALTRSFGVPTLIGDFLISGQTDPGRSIHIPASRAINDGGFRSRAGSIGCGLEARDRRQDAETHGRRLRRPVPDSFQRVLRPSFDGFIKLFRGFQDGVHSGESTAYSLASYGASTDDAVAVEQCFGRRQGPRSGVDVAIR